MQVFFIFKVFKIISQLMATLIFSGVIINVLFDLQSRASHHSRLGLIRMHGINTQLVGRTR